MKLDSIASRFQRRLLNSHKYEDYLYVVIIGLVPIIFSMLIKMWEHKDIGNYKYTGYQDAWNFIAHIVILPVGLFILRLISDVHFSVNLDNNKPDNSNKAPILAFFSNDAQLYVYDKLRTYALTPINIYLVLTLDLVFHLFDNFGKIMIQYFQVIMGQKPSNLEINWANLYLVNDQVHINIFTNLVFTLSAYAGQFLVFLLGISGYILILKHNIFTSKESTREVNQIMI